MIPTSTTFTKTLTGSSSIDFSAHVADTETTDANITIKLATLPTKGVLTVSGNAAVVNTAYAIAAITYTSNADQCSSSYSDSFTYKAVDQASADSNVSTVNISANAHNCIASEGTFTKTISGSSVIDFAPHISDSETTDANLEIKVKTLPTKGVLTVSGNNAVIDTKYAVNAITYTSNANQCASAYSDSFTYKVVDHTSAESPVATVQISATAHNCLPVLTTFTKTVTGSATIDFSSHVSDSETPDANITIKLATLPTKGV